MISKLKSRFKNYLMRKQVELVQAFDEESGAFEITIGIVGLIIIVIVVLVLCGDGH